MAKDFTYTLHLDAETGNLTNKLNALKGQLGNLTTDGKEPRIAKIITDLEARLDSLMAKTKQPIKSEAAFGAMQKDIEGINKALSALDREIVRVQSDTKGRNLSILPKDEVKRINLAANAITNYKKSIEAASAVSKDYQKAQVAAANAVNNLNANQKTIESTQREQTLAVQAEAEARRRLDEIKKQPDASIEQIRQAELEYENASRQVTALSRSLANLQKNEVGLKTEVQLTSEELKKQEKAFKSNSTQQRIDAFNTLIEVANKLGVSFENLRVNADGSLSRTAGNVNELLSRIQTVADSGANQAAQALNNVALASSNLGRAADEATNGLRRENDAMRQQNEVANDVGGLINRIKQFTGVAGAAIIMRRALRSAFSTIKELDKQMTEMAVVTDLEVGDYWKQLPEHTERASQLGMAIKDVYEAETLYYQQGLKSAQVTQLSTSTLKMARIASLSAEDATNKMTAALRGFNMEINQTNADRIADVYSKLAAITASNVQEISTAMTKTASIASNAGMEFETTAAFLSQIIETTRESAETAGTALKTVIARFQELKKAPEEIGEIDGEIVDANKIETALRTVGVALRDASGQFRDLDDVFIDLASKWDTLDMNTQRYIATIAAGSRQQSRFVAMMSNYERTMTLVNAANNSAGASTEQFNKTLESLESKLAALKNAWDNFTMGLANNEFVKGMIDILTQILNAINAITEGFGPWSSSALKIGLLTAALIAGNKAITIFMTSLRSGSSVLGAFSKVSTAAGNSVKRLALSIRLGTKEQVRYTAVYKQGKTAATQYAAANKLATQTQILRNNAEKSGLLTSKTQAAYDTILAKTEQQKAAAVLNAATAYGLSIPQQAEAQILTSIGLDLNQAAILAAQGLTKEKLKEAAAAQLGADATEEEILARAQELGLLWAQQTAEKSGNVEKSKGILLRLAEASANLLVKLGLGSLLPAKWADRIASQQQTQASAANTVAKYSEASANLTLMETMWPILVITLLITAAVLALIATVMIITALVKAIQSQTLEGQIDAQKEKVKQYNEILENTRQALDNLRESHEKYNELQDTYKNLTKGTKEWREALLAANKQVLDLVANYPQLAKYIQRDGELLTIEQEGWDELLRKQEQAVALNTSASLGAQAQLASLEAERDTRDYYDKYSLEFQSEDFLTLGGNLSTLGTTLSTLDATTIGLTAGVVKAEKEIRRVTDDWGAFGTILQGTHSGALLSTFMGPVLGNIVGFASTILSQQEEARRKQQTQDFAAAMLENGLSFEEMDKGAVQDLYQSIFDKELTDEIYTAMSNSSDALFALGESTLAARAELDLFADQLISNALDMANISNEWRSSLQGLGNGILSGANVEGDIDSTIEDLQDSLDFDEALRKYADITGQFYKNGQIYSTGNIAEQNEDTQINVAEDIVWEVLAQNKLITEAATKLDSYSTELQRASLTMSKTEKERAKRILSNDASILTSSDLLELQKAGGVPNWLQSKGINLELTDEMLAKLNESIANANQDTLARRANLLQTVEGTIDDITLGNITAGLTGKGLQGLTSSFETLVDNFGSETAARVAETIEDFGSQLSSEELREVFNAQVASADWTNVESFQNLTEVLETMANVTDQDRIILDAWAKSMGAATYALSTVDLESVRKQVKSLNSTIKEMFEGNRNIEDDEYKNLISMGFSESDFQKTAEGYRYLGQTGDLLRSASEAAYQGVIAAEANFAASAAATQHSMDVIASLEAEIAANANLKQEADTEELSAIQALWRWVLEKLQQIKETIENAMNWLYNNIIHPVGEFFSTMFGRIYDFFVLLYNEIGKTLTEWYTHFCNVFINLLNGLIDFYNDNLSWLFGQIDKIDTKKNDFQSAETLDQIKRRQQLADEQAKLAKQIEEDTENLKKIAEAYAQAADAIDIGVLNSAQERYAAEYVELTNKMNAATSETIRNGYAKQLEAMENVLNSLDKSLMSKSLAYDELAPDVQRFQEALKAGNTEVANDLRYKLINAIGTKEAGKRLKKAFSQIGDELESLLSTNLSDEALEKTLHKSLEQWAYTLGFHNIDQGVQLLAQHFDLLSGIIEGNEEAWRSFQKALLEDKGTFYIEGEIDYSEINNGLRDLGNHAQDALNQLLDTGAFKLQKITATNTVQVPNITYQNGFPVVDGMIPVEAGSMYWQLVPTDMEDLEIEKKDLTGEKPDMWINPYGWLYNLNQASDKTIQKREDAEWRYQRALAASGTSAKTLLDLLKQQAQADRDAMVLEQQRYNNAKRSMQTLIDGSPAQFSDFIHVGSNGQISVDSDSLFQVKWTSDMGSVFEDWMGQIEEVLDEMRNSLDNLQDARDRAAERKVTGRSEYGNLVSQIKDAFVDRFQREIDLMSDINDSITDAQSQLLDKLQEQIDDERQAREEEKARTDIEDKQTRLAYLEASGGNALEILKLQKEIENDQEAYQDSLVDNSISAIEKANQHAADQRQKQIDIAQAQLDWWSEHDSSAYAEAQLNAWLEKGSGFAMEQIEELFNATTTRNLSSVEMTEWKEETENAVALAETWRSQTAYQYYSSLEKSLDNTIDELTNDYNALNAGHQSLQNYVDENGILHGQISSDKSIDLENSVKLDKLKEDWREAKNAYADAAKTQYDASNKQLEAALKNISAATIVQETFGDNSKNPTNRLPDVGSSLSDSDKAHALLDILQANHMQPGDRGLDNLTKDGKTMTIDGQRLSDIWVNLDDWWRDWIRQSVNVNMGCNKGSLLKFASGGLVDSTGPAWLDGTKSAPEMVLDATDTANLITLKDILADILRDARSRSEDKSNADGANYYDIDVHVDSISDEYDVDQAVNHMRELIEADAMYRNVNAVQKTR